MSSGSVALLLCGRCVKACRTVVNAPDLRGPHRNLL